MGDIYCKRCGEPWNAYGVRMALLYDEGDMTKDEACKFTSGIGCPTCKFGKKKTDIKIDDMLWFIEIYEEFSR